MVDEKFSSTIVKKTEKNPKVNIKVNKANTQTHVHKPRATLQLVKIKETVCSTNCWNTDKPANQAVW